MQKTMTKRMLADAYLKLAKKKPLDKISVSDIVSECNAGRQTFYNHFQDKEALAAWIVFHDVDNSINDLPPDISFRDVIIRNYNYMEDNRFFYEKMFRTMETDAIFMDIINQTIRFHTQIIEQNQGKPLDKEQSMQLRLFDYGFCNVQRERFMNPSADESVEAYVDSIIACIPLSIKPYLAGAVQIESKSVFSFVHNVEKIVKGPIY